MYSRESRNEAVSRQFPREQKPAHNFPGYVVQGVAKYAAERSADQSARHQSTSQAIDGEQPNRTTYI